MARTPLKTSQKKNAALSMPDATPTEAKKEDVLTLAEAAAYLRVSDQDILRTVIEQALPGRRVGGEWRFLKPALQEWLRSPPPRPSKEALRACIGTWKDDPDLEDMLKDIYRRRGRPMTERGE